MSFIVPPEGYFLNSLCRKIQKIRFVTGGDSGCRVQATNIDHLHIVVSEGKTANIPVRVKPLGSVPILREKQWHTLECSSLLSARNHKKVLDGFVIGKHESLEAMLPDLYMRELPENKFIEK